MKAPVLENRRGRSVPTSLLLTFAAIAIASVMFTDTTHASNVETVLHNFSGPDGAEPEFSLLRDTAGNLFGVTGIGGANGFGTVFEISAQGVEQVLYSFKGGTDGKIPSGRLIMDGAGNLYGVTGYGGRTQSYGTLYRLSPGLNGNWTETILYKFTFAGYYPYGGLNFDAAGNIYGTTAASGPPCKCGSVFKLSPGAKGKWTSSILYHFLGGVNDGANPNGDLVFDGAGNLYGTTTWGGAGSDGTVFELSPGLSGAWTEKVIHSFLPSDGFAPVAGLIIDQAGNLYGTTFQGGTFNTKPCVSTGCGTVFELSPSGGSWTETVVYSFTGGNDGSSPRCVLALHGGSLYGTTFIGGTSGVGMVFMLSTSGGGWTKQVLHTFANTPDGSHPQGGVTFDDAGNIYGGTFDGGTGGRGTVYQISN